MNDRIDALTDLLMETGRAHHEAFEATDGVDPDWPLFYADHLHARIGALIEAQPTRSDLVALLVHLDRAQTTEAPGAPWARYYAKSLVARYL